MSDVAPLLVPRGRVVKAALWAALGVIAIGPDISVL